MTAEAAHDERPLLLALRGTLVALLLQPVGVELPVRAAALALAALGLLVPSALRRPELWGALCLVATVRVALDWPLPDNHAYLLAYWCLAVALALSTRAPVPFLAWNARVLVGLVFAFATGWKLASPDFRDGSFFAVTFLLDPRFEEVARLAAGFTPDALEAARAFVGAHVDGAATVGAAGPTIPARFFALARAASVWTLALEALVALAFLWPRGRGPSRARDPLLLLFCATTFAVAPVEGFAWLLLSMGVAQCDRRPGLYVATYLLVMAYLCLRY